MRILLVTHRYPPLGVAGVERLSEQTAVALTGAGHEVIVLTRHEAQAPPFPKRQGSQRRGVPVITIAGGGPQLGRFPRLGPAVERMFERTLIELQPDVVLASHLLGHSPTYVSLALRWGVPVVLEVHDFYVACELAHLQRISGELCRGPEGGGACATHCFPADRRAPERWALRTHMFRHAVQQADALVCPSRFVADYTEATFGPLMAPLHVIGNGVELVPPPPAPASRRPGLHIAFVGVVGPHKGAHVIVEALRLAQLPSARLTLFGPPIEPYFREVIAAAESVANLEVHAYGAFEPPELPALLSDVDAVVIPSLVWESYSMVAHEALACGVPVIASRLGALPEAVRDGHNGLLFEPGSAVDLAAKLQMLTDDVLRTLRDGIERSDWITVAERTRTIQTLLAQVVAAGTTRALPEVDELTIMRDALLASS